MIEKTIIVIEDDLETGTLIKEFLERHFYQIQHFEDAQASLNYLKENNKVCLIIMDILLPGMHGYELCRKIRSNKITSNIPIIMLTAMESEADCVIGLELGADDYVSKPFSLRELLARIRCVLRRTETLNTQLPEHQTSKFPILKFSNWSLHTASRRLFLNELEINLTSKSYALLLAFLKNPQRVLSRDQLLDIISNRSAEPFDRSIDIQVSRLRQKIEVDPSKPVFIKTVRNGGYMFTATVSETW